MGSTPAMIENAIASGIRAKATTVPARMSARTFPSQSWREEEKNIVSKPFFDFEKDIGYAEVVQAGNTYYVSGVVCEGPGYQKAVPECYKELQSILDKLQLTSKNIVKENVWARDIEQFKEQIEQRKKFYGNDNYPAASWIQVDRFYLPTHLVEIELILVK